MVTKHRGSNFHIEIRMREHGVPHIHVISPDFMASVAIDSGDILKGKLPRKVHSQVREWLADNRADALATP